MLATASVSDPSLWSQFGPFGICLFLLGSAIVWLLRERAKDKATIEAGELRERALYDRIIASGEQFAPVLERNTRALERVEGQR